MLFKYIIFFLVINFGALALGSYLMGTGPTGNWYLELNKAPWTPPGWVFGAAWRSIMLCFSVYMSYLYLKRPDAGVISLFSIQFILNIIWNYIFFNQHLISLGLATIVALTFIITRFTLRYRQTLKLKTLLIVPYFIWLCIATSLNAYIFIYN